MPKRTKVSVVKKKLTPGQKIKIGIIKLNMNQNDFAQMIDMHYSTLSGIVTGKLYASEEQRKKIAKGLGSRVKVLFRPPCL